MRVLLLSANTGEGHNSTAKAVMEVLEARNVTCDLRDTLEFVSPRFSKFICSCHTRIYNHVGKLFDMGYRAMELSASPDEYTPVYDLLALGAPKLYKLLQTEDYDAIICVHPFSGAMMTEVRRVWDAKIPCYFVATDYTCSPTVEQCDLDGYFIPDERLSPEFVRAGLPKERLLPSGIPVRQAFYHPGNQAMARAFLDLPEQGRVILLMCGSTGCGPIRKIAKGLLDGLEAGTTVVAVCGNNEKLFESLRELEEPRLRVVGFTTEVSDYMDAADMIVTKPGGLSSTEAANKHLPMVLINTVGGCESRNFDFFLQQGFALGSADAEQVVKLATALAEDSFRLEHIRTALRESFGENSAQRIADCVCAAAESYRNGMTVRDSIELPASGHPTCEKGGCDMDNQQKLTVTNLARAFAGEAQARTRYTVYAGIARKEGHEWIARIFEETAANEAVHAEEFLEHLQAIGACAPNIDLLAGYPFQLGTTRENLAFAAEGELHEHDAAYPEFAEIARREGFDDAARLWMQIARIEGVHHNTFRKLHEQLVSGTLTEKETPVTWRCLNCGYTYQGIRACDPCPVCGKEAGWQEGQLDTKMLMQKE